MSCCHGNHQKGQGQAQHDQHGGNHKSHNWMMIICCVLPIALAALYFITKGTSGSLGNGLPLLLILICPLSHLIMMPFMNRKRNNL